MPISVHRRAVGQGGHGSSATQLMRAVGRLPPIVGGMVKHIWARSNLLVGLSLLAHLLAGCSSLSLRPTESALSATPASIVEPTATPVVPELVVVYSRLIDDKVQLYGRTASGADVLLSTDELGREPLPLEYLATKHEVVYVAKTPDDLFMLKALNVLTRSTRALLPAPAPAVYRPQVAPDGSQVAYQFEDPISGSDRWSTRIISYQDGSEMDIIENSLSFSWSENSQSVAYLDYMRREGELSRSIWVRNMDGSSQEIRAPAEVEVLRVAWNGSRDELLVIGENPVSKPNLYRVDLKTGRFDQLTSDLLIYEPVTVSPDGSRMAFVTTPNEGNSLYVLETNSGTFRRFDLPTGWYLEPSWSQDGRSIAVKAMVFSDSPPRERMYIADAIDWTWSELGDALVDSHIIQMVFVK